MKRLAGLLALALPLAGTAHAQDQAPPAPAAAAQRSRPQIEIPRATQPPNLDDYVSLASSRPVPQSGTQSQAGPASTQGSVSAMAVVSGGSSAATSVESTRGLRIDGFLQRDPGDLVPISQPTEAFLSYDATNFYVVFVCRTSEPSQLRARMARRESMFSDDFVAVILDTFDDHQRGYEFFSNPLGIQADGITTEGQNDDMSFDTVWQSKGRLTDFGYVVSFAIPFKSLRFPSAEGRAWGIALMRGIPANNEQAFWPGVTHTIGSFASQMADVHGLTGVSPGRNIQLIPYGTFTGARFLDESTFDSKADARVGLDGKIVAHDVVTIDLTANPDFSQVESDEPQVTINQRFEVFFPEKRPFFLENAGYFQTPINLFFSRRISDPQIGARATGKLGGWAAGALALDDRGPGHAVEAVDPNFGDRAFNAVGRVRREFGDSSVGAFVTSHDFGPTSNRVISADTRLKVNSRIFVDGQAAAQRYRVDRGRAASRLRLLGHSESERAQALIQRQLPGHRAGLPFDARVRAPHRHQAGERVPRAPMASEDGLRAIVRPELIRPGHMGSERSPAGLDRALSLRGSVQGAVRGIRAARRVDGALRGDRVPRAREPVSILHQPGQVAGLQRQHGRRHSSKLLSRARPRSVPGGFSRISLPAPRSGRFRDCCWTRHTSTAISARGPRPEAAAPRFSTTTSRARA